MEFNNLQQTIFGILNEEKKAKAQSKTELKTQADALLKKHKDTEEPTDAEPTATDINNVVVPNPDEAENAPKLTSKEIELKHRDAAINKWKEKGFEELPTPRGTGSYINLKSPLSPEQKAVASLNKTNPAEKEHEVRYSSQENREKLKDAHERITNAVASDLPHASAKKQEAEVERVKAQGRHFSRLAGVKKELSGIVGILKNKQRILDIRDLHKKAKEIQADPSHEEPEDIKTIREIQAHFATKKGKAEDKPITTPTKKKNPVAGNLARLVHNQLHPMEGPEGENREKPTRIPVTKVAADNYIRSYGDKVSDVASKEDMTSEKPTSDVVAKPTRQWNPSEGHPHLQINPIRGSGGGEVTANKERRKKELEVINKENPENKEILKARIAAMLRKKNTTPDSDM